MKSLMKLMMTMTVLIASMQLVAMYEPDLDRQLVNAASQGKYNKVQKLLARGASASEPEALWLAAMSGYEDVCRLLLANGADPAELNLFAAAPNETPLIKAVQAPFYRWDPNAKEVEKKKVGMVKFLIENGADMSLANDAGGTAAMKAAHGGVLPIIRVFLTTIPKADRERILRENLRANILASHWAFKKTEPALPRDVRKLITQPSIDRLVDEQMRRIEQLLAARNHDGNTVFDYVKWGAKECNRGGEAEVSVLFDLNNPQTRAWLRHEFEKNIRKILFSDPKKKE